MLAVPLGWATRLMFHPNPINNIHASVHHEATQVVDRPPWQSGVYRPRRRRTPLAYPRHTVSFTTRPSSIGAAENAAFSQPRVSLPFMWLAVVCDHNRPDDPSRTESWVVCDHRGTNVSIDRGCSITARIRRRAARASARDQKCGKPAYGDVAEQELPYPRCEQEQRER